MRAWPDHVGILWGAGNDTTLSPICSIRHGLVCIQRPANWEPRTAGPEACHSGDAATTCRRRPPVTNDDRGVQPQSRTFPAASLLARTDAPPGAYHDI
jgi:hypothetical protein